VVVIAFFLLASGDEFRRKLARIAGPTFGRRKLTVLTLDEIAQQIRRYLVVQVATSLVVGAATAAAYAALGLNHVAAWAVAAAVLNLVPYVGSTVVVIGTAAAALQQFGSIEQALLFAAVALGLRILTGFVLSPWLTARASRLNPVTVFLGVLFWGWLWGAWGLLLGTPVLMVVKAVCDRVDPLRPLGELMGSEPVPGASRE
jgi:predicted PurR-regulated permease PerM